MKILKTPYFHVGITLSGMLLCLLLVLMSIPKSWKEATKRNNDGTLSLADDWTGTIDRKLDKFENHHLYMLVATQNGYYLCKHCPTGNFYLREGELYRYGTTGDGKEGRGYNEEWLENNKLSYIHLLTAELTLVRAQQTLLIGHYSLNSENLKRPLIDAPKAKPYWYRLVLPPGNNSLD